MKTLIQLIESNTPIETIASYLDFLPLTQRLNEVKTLGAKLQEKLFAISKTGVTLDDFLPPSGAPNKTVIFHGHNSLPAFNGFQKRMARSSDGKTILGYNHQTLSPITGPGYFVISNQTARPGEMQIDYTQLPPGKPSDWPKLKSNDKGISKLIYGNLKDYMRRVSRDVFIGEATKNGKRVGFFILCRE